MSLTRQLRQLQEMHRTQIDDLNRTYLRTKREIRRGISPRRLVRRHPATAVAMAAALGLLVAPARRDQPGAIRPFHRRRGVFAALIRRLFRTIRYMLRRKDNPQAAAQTAAAPPHSHAAPSLVEALLASLITSLNLDKLLAGLVHGLTEKIRGGFSRHHQGNGRHPQTAPPTRDGPSAESPSEDPFESGHN